MARVSRIQTIMTLSWDVLTTMTPADQTTEGSPTETLEDKEALERLRAALLKLRPEEQAIFLLRQNGDFTYEEIAELRRSPVGTVKTQMRAALHKLRQVLQDK